MVDLVKIRKKSKDAKDASREAALVEPPAPQPPPKPELPVSTPVAAAPAAAATIDAKRDPEPAPEPAPVPAPAKPKKQAKSAPQDAVPEPPASDAGESTQTPAFEAAAEPERADEDRLARFKRLAGKRRSWEVVSRTPEQAEPVAAEADLELLRFRVAGEDYAVDIDKIVEIVPPRSTTRVPNAEESIVGIMSLRGTIVTVIDLRRKLGHPQVALDTLKDARMIVVERAGETAGFLVDRVSRVVKLDRAQIENHPVVSLQEQSEYVSGVFQAQDGLVILLDIERILAG